MGHAGRVLQDQLLKDLAGELVAVNGVVGVVLGGSRARGEHTPESDIDLGLYYRAPLDVPGLQGLAHGVAETEAVLTQPGDWGPWVNGGGWLQIRGTAVDWIYRDLDRVYASWAAAQAGRYAFHTQIGHPLGVPDFAYAGELALGVLLADPSGELSALQHQARRYPPRLSEALVAGLWEAGFALDIAHKAVARADTSYVAGCLFRTVQLCAHALHGHSGRWLINEKGAIAAAGRLPGAPEHFTERAHNTLAHLGRDPEDLQRALVLARALLTDTTSACCVA